MTNTPDKSETVEQRAREIYDQFPDVFWNSHSETRGHRHWGDLTEERREHFRDLARASSRPPADQVPDMVERVARAMIEPLGYVGKSLDDAERIWVGNNIDDAETGSLAYLCRQLARAAIATLQAVPAASEVDRLPENYELSHGPLNGDMSDCAWQVHSINGGYNDREWTLVATGETPSEAIIAALKASGEE